MMYSCQEGGTGWVTPVSAGVSAVHSQGLNALTSTVITVGLVLSSHSRPTLCGSRGGQMQLLLSINPYPKLHQEHVQPAFNHRAVAGPISEPSGISLIHFLSPFFYFILFCFFFVQNSLRVKQHCWLNVQRDNQGTSEWRTLLWLVGQRGLFASFGCWTRKRGAAGRLADWWLAGLQVGKNHDEPC